MKRLIVLAHMFTLATVTVSAQDNNPKTVLKEMLQQQQRHPFTAKPATGNNTTIENTLFNESITNLYPIPAQDMVHVATRKGAGLNKVQLFNSAGQLEQEYDAGGKVHFAFYVSSMPEGIYFVKSYTGNGTSMHRIAVIH